MTSTASLLTVAIGALCSTLMAQTTESLPVYNLPGRLASFLTDHPGATSEKKSLGSLAGRKETGATFTAIIASDPAHPNIEAKGLEVRIMHQDYRGQPQETAVYLDEDSLKNFQLALEDAAKDQEFVAAHAQELGPLELEKPHVAGAVNHVTGAQELLKIKADKAIVFSAGWYREKESGEFGSYLDSAPGVALYLPKTLSPNSWKSSPRAGRFWTTNASLLQQETNGRRNYEREPRESSLCQNAVGFDSAMSL